MDFRLVLAPGVKEGRLPSSSAPGAREGRLLSPPSGATEARRARAPSFSAAPGESIVHLGPGMQG